MPTTLHTRLRTSLRTHGKLARRPRRRGSVLILVVGVLVLLAISAAAYLSVGQLERVSSDVQKSDVLRAEVAQKVMDHLGGILTADLFGGYAVGNRPFGDPVDIDDDGNADALVPELWDYAGTPAGPIPDRTTGRGMIEDFQENLIPLIDVQSDRWLAASEPVSDAGDANFGLWPAISSVHPEGRFVDLDRLFQLNRGGIYSNNFYISGGTPRDWAVFNPEMDVRLQLDDVDSTSTGYPTFLDQRYGTDTDGDGRIDARWTELPDVYGMPEGMRVFVAVRIVDSSSMVNVNTSVESGVTPVPVATDIGTGKYPTDIDLYSLLWDEFRIRALAANRPATEQIFVSGNNEQSTGVGGFAEHLRRTGFIDSVSTNYNPLNRLNAEARGSKYLTLAANPFASGTGLRPYSPSDELELRLFGFTGNDRMTSRLERIFTDLNYVDLSANPDEYYYSSPLADLQPQGLDYANDLPNFLTPGSLPPDNDNSFKQFGMVSRLDPGTGMETGGDIRHLLTTYSGHQTVQAWSPMGSGNGSSILARPNINRLLLPASGKPDLQRVTSGFMWALAPFAVDTFDADSRASTTSNIYLSREGAFIRPASASSSYSYGGGDARFAFVRSAMLATNAKDTLDDDEQPTVKRLRFEDVPANPDVDEITARFEHGSLMSDGLVSSTNMYLIGAERAPFLREATTIIVYVDDDYVLNGPDVFIEDPDERVMELIAVEIGNPWDSTIDLGEYTIRALGADGNRIRLPLSGNLEPGEYSIFYTYQGNGTDADNLALDWKNMILARTGTPEFSGNITEVKTLLPIDFADSDNASITLWRNNVSYVDNNGTAWPDLSVMVDRLASSNGAGFPRILDESSSDAGPYTGVPAPCFVTMGSIRRPGGSLAGSGFPAYVTQSSTAVTQSGKADVSFKGPDATTTPPPNLFTTMQPTDFIDFLNGDEDKGFSLNEWVHSPFELRIFPGDPAVDREFRTSADLLTLTSVTTVNLGATAQTGGNPQSDFDNPSNYITMSEFLGDEAADTFPFPYNSIPGNQLDWMNILHPGTVTAPNDSYERSPDTRVARDESGLLVANPFVGKLDYTRDIPHDENGVTLPYSAIPLAARVLEAFEAIDLPSGSSMALGRVNINTASERVLRTLPFVFPRHDLNLGDGVILQGHDPANRVYRAIAAYRDRESVYPGAGNTLGFMNWANRAETSKLYANSAERSGLRDDFAAQRNGLGPHGGVSSLSEIPLVTQWGYIGGGINWTPAHAPNNRIEKIDDLPNQSLARFGHDGPPGSPADLTLDALRPLENPDRLSTYPFDPANDVGEWLALPRALVNTVSVRSDVYVCYLTVIGVSANDIKAAQQKAGQLGVEPLEVLTPTMEQSYMVVFDRSNVRSASDRPRVLFAVQEAPRR